MTEAYIVETCARCPLLMDAGCDHPGAIPELHRLEEPLHSDLGSEETVPDVCPLRESAYWVELSWRLREERER